MSKTFARPGPDSYDTILTLENKWLNKAKGGGGAPLDPVVSAWVARAQANGGNPSTNSKNAVNTFWLACKAAGIDSKMIHVNCIAPDDYPTATTPLIVGPGGRNQWFDVTGALQALQTNLLLGLIGNKSGRFDTGVIPAATSLTTTDSGITIYVSVKEPDGTSHCHGGCDDYPGNPYSFKLIYDFEYISYSTVTSPNGFVVAADFKPWNGFASCNLLAGPVWAIYAYGSSVGAYRQLTNTGGGGTIAGNVVSTKSFSWLDCNGQFGEPTGETISFAAFHNGLNSTPAQAFFNAVQAMRVSFGGGYV